MSTFILYPAIDLRRGKVVRLKEGDPARQTEYADDPARVAQTWLGEGASWLHVVDLDGAFSEPGSSNRLALGAIIEEARAARGFVQFGGGLRSLEAIEQALDLGVQRAVLGTMAVEQPGVVAQAINRFGAGRIAVGIDARDGWVRTRGWQAGSGIEAAALGQRVRDLGIRTLIYTDISRDGMGRGLNIESTRALADAAGIDVIASGGVSTADDVIAARNAGLAGVIIGRALYEGTVGLRDMLERLGPAAQVSSDAQDHAPDPGLPG